MKLRALPNFLGTLHGRPAAFHAADAARKDGVNPQGCQMLRDRQIPCNCNTTYCGARPTISGSANGSVSTDLAPETLVRDGAGTFPRHRSELSGLLISLNSADATETAE